MFRKGLILAGGRSSRLYPSTTAIGKPLLPIYDKPMIYYPLGILMQAMVKEICIISNPHDLPLFKELLGTGEQWGINLNYKIQYEPKGIADVFFVANDFIRNQSCALILGDNIFIGSEWQNRLNHIQKQPISGAQIIVKPVKDPERYGVIKYSQQGEIIDLLEKPNPAPSDLAITGLYFYDEQATELAHQLKPSARGELEITDLNRLYLNHKKLSFTLLDKTDDQWLDTGTHESLYEATQNISNYIHTQNKQIGCLEEIAYLNGWIDENKLENISHRLRHTSYGKYLEQYFINQKIRT